jgi:hypothetical protein
MCSIDYHMECPQQIEANGFFVLFCQNAPAFQTMDEFAIRSHTYEVKSNNRLIIQRREHEQSRKYACKTHTHRPLFCMFSIIKLYEIYALNGFCSIQKGELLPCHAKVGRYLKQRLFCLPKILLIQ